MFIFLLPFFFVYFLLQLKNVEIVSDCIDFWVCLSEYILDLEEQPLVEVEEKKEIIPEKIEPKYEEKYMEQINLLDSEFIFTEEEEETNKKLFQIEKEKIQTNIYHLEREIHYLYSELNKVSSQEEEENNKDKEETHDFDLQEYQEETTNKIQNLEKELEVLKKNEKDDESLYEKVEKTVIEQRLEKFKSSFVMEKTPLGNVVMYYNAKRETFEYYSDSNIPYRFLEVVARKYVTTFHCRPLYVIMEEELKKYEKKLELQKEKQIQQQQNQNKTQQNKKPIFAKFKSYNKEAGSGRVNKAPPPKNSIPNAKNNKPNNSNEPCILKENANRYTYEGRFSNFSPLQKIERKQIDKKYAISFSDFKKMQKNEIENIMK